MTEKPRRWTLTGPLVGPDVLVEGPDLPDRESVEVQEASVEESALAYEAERAEQRVKELEAALFECAKWSGADISDGAPTWPPIHEWAVQEVKELREQYDEALKEIPLTPKDGNV